MAKSEGKKIVRMDYQSNHNLILETIDILMEKQGKFPTKTDIAKETGLSRNSVDSHLSEIQHDINEIQTYINTSRRQNVLNKLLAITDDESGSYKTLEILKAADLFLKYTSNDRNQNNIQVNVNNEQPLDEKKILDKLDVDELTMLESLLKKIHEDD